MIEHVGTTILGTVMWNRLTEKPLHKILPESSAGATLAMVRPSTWYSLPARYKKVSGAKPGLIGRFYRLRQGL